MSGPTSKAERAAGEGATVRPARPDIAERVLDYFRRNAMAMDSVEGIARFWVHEDRAVVERCLIDLHARGLLEKRTIAGADFYSVPEPERSAPSSGLVSRREGMPVAVRPAAPAKAPAGSPPRGRILVVDDDNAVRSFLVEALTDVGHSVAAAPSGERAIEMFRAQPFDLVLADVMMPGISGLDLLVALKQSSPAIEVIVVTAHASLDTAMQALRSGAYDLVTKPLNDLESLERVVERALERRGLQAENRLLVESLQARNIELTETVARLAAINEIGKATSGLLDAPELYDSLARLVAQHLKARRVSVLVCEPDSDTMSLVASVGITDEAILRTRVRVGEGIAGRVAASLSPLLVPDIGKSGLREVSSGGKYATGSFMVTPLTVAYPIRFRRSRVGVINVSDKHSGEPFTEQDLEYLSTLAAQVAVVIENTRLVKEMEDGYLGVLTALVRGSEDAREETRGHSRRVAELAVAVAQEMKVPESRIELLQRAASLHEVGRMSQRGSSPAGSALGGEEAGEDAGAWTAAAALAAESVLAPITSLRAAREIILHSADRFDTLPLPFGADRPAIAVESRILGACEELVRLGAGGGHPEAWGAALRALREKAGRSHDPEVVAALVRILGRGEAP